MMDSGVSGKIVDEVCAGYQLGECSNLSFVLETDVGFVLGSFVISRQKS